MLRNILITSMLVLISPAVFTQVGHPAKGSWSGTLTADDGDSQRIRLLIEAWNGELSGYVNPGRRAVEFNDIDLDAPQWKLVIEADMPDGKLVLDGTLANLGSWTNRKYTGEYSLGNQKGEFDITLN